MRRAIGIAISVLFLNLSPAFAANPPQPTGISAFHRSGQSFITWTERSTVTGERYRLYRHGQSITSANIASAVRLGEVWEGSGRFFADRYNVDASGTWRARYFDRFVIRNLAAQLRSGTGLLVWTLSTVDFEGARRGSAYYAVTSVDGSGVENRTDFTSANTFGPVPERVADPAPVEILRGDNGRGHVYTQYMDLRNWNPTFHAPHEANAYFGLNASDPAVASSIQYAYTYTVGEPDPANCPSPMPDRFPVILNLHGWGDNTYPPDTGASEYFCGFEIRPIDVSETWWLGFARDHDYREGSTVAAGDTVVNFTELRVMRMVYDLLRDPVMGPKTDPNRVFVYGHSMGGSGTLALSLRYPNVFSASYASEPMTNYLTSSMWVDNAALKWGSPALDLPIEIRGPGDWAANLQRFNGTRVWRWQNHQANARNRASDDFVPFGVGHGRQDTTIDWQTQGKPAYAAFDAGRHAWGGAILDSEHEWLGFAGLLPVYAADDSLVPFAGLRAVRNETVPGLSAASGNFPLPPPDTGPTGGYNQAIEWSASWDRWDRAPIDTVKTWGVSLRTTKGSTRLVDVTPRRLQNFRVAPNRAYKWSNRKVSDNSLVASGTATASPAGVLTVRRVTVTPGGNRLKIVPLRQWPDTTRSIRVFNDQLGSGMSAAQVRFAATHYAGVQKVIRSDADLLRAENPNFIILHYRLGPGLGYRETQNGCEPTGNWLNIINGNDWVREWPGNTAVAEKWFFHWPSAGATRVLNCDWGWYLMELNNKAYRDFWLGSVLSQLQANDNDGVFMDSMSVPNYLGFDHYNPHLPEVNAAFELSWSARISGWISWLQKTAMGSYYLVPNVGAWNNSRDATDFGAADGLMVEGFAIEADASPYILSDWQLQMNRVAGAVRKRQAVIGQSYAAGGRERMFALGSYLLVKGSKTYLNIDIGEQPEWWPEYDIPIGKPTRSIVSSVAELDPDGDNIYRRSFDNGFVLVNPTNPWDDPPGVSKTISLGRTYYLAVASGGGEVPATGIPTGSLTYRAVTSVTLPPYSAAVLLNAAPAAASAEELPME